MKYYAVVKVGNGYVVEVNHLRVMKFTSRRKALRLVAEAALLLDEVRVAAPANELSLNRERPNVS